MTTKHFYSPQVNVTSSIKEMQSMSTGFTLVDINAKTCFKISVTKSCLFFVKITFVYDRVNGKFGDVSRLGSNFGNFGREISLLLEG